MRPLRLSQASIKGDLGLGPGTDFTFGDVAMFEALNAIINQFKIAILRPFPNLKEWHDHAANRPAVLAHLASRPLRPY